MLLDPLSTSSETSIVSFLLTKGINDTWGTRENE